ncbi:MAG: hypothetical protein SAK42_11490 [Oscillatoria sp. PMC 1076.18]|nr:hypothetical protein [Oscillatoria sp. PMC 1076.18]
MVILPAKMLVMLEPLVYPDCFWLVPVPLFNPYLTTAIATNNN